MPSSLAQPPGQSLPDCTIISYAAAAEPDCIGSASATRSWNRPSARSSHCRGGSSFSRFSSVALYRKPKPLTAAPHQQPPGSYISWPPKVAGICAVTSSGSFIGCRIPSAAIFMKLSSPPPKTTSIFDVSARR